MEFYKKMEPELRKNLVKIKLKIFFIEFSVMLKSMRVKNLIKVKLVL